MLINQNPNAPRVHEAQQMCETFIGFVRERYPQLNQIRYKISRNGRAVQFRARYRRRAIHAEGSDIRRTMAGFYRYLVIKLSLEAYYTSRSQVREKKQQEPFRIALGPLTVHPTRAV